MSEDPVAVETRGKILVVDDDNGARAVVVDGLRQAGFTVQEAGSGDLALQKLSADLADAVLSDIALPGLTGIEMLRTIRARGFEVPVVLLTGHPSLETAIQAVEAGALRYLRKPATVAEIAETMDLAVKLSRLAQWRREAMAVTRPSSEAQRDRASLEMAFDEALDGLWLAAQPIVGARDGAIFGIELLARSISTRFSSVNTLLAAAEKLNRIPAFGRRVRQIAANVELAPEHALFVNVHSLELEDEDLFSDKNPLRHLGSKVVLEVTERQSMGEVKNLVEKVARLREIGFWIAVDDMGAGHADLNSFAALKPDLAKLDVTLVRGIDQDPYRQTLVRSMVSMCRDFGIPLVAEGVEREGEKAALVDLGCDFLQGFLCGAPRAPRLRPPGSARNTAASPKPA